MNSLDTPQYFTTEAIIRHHSLDMSYFKKDPHYFITPDFAEINGNSLNLHGFMLSIIAVPIHLISLSAKNLFTARLFDSSVVTKNFTYELSITSFFVLFSVLGMFFVWKSLILVTKNKLMSTLTIFFTGVGSYIWKWSATYQRQGIIVFIVGLGIYLLTDTYINKKNKHFWIWCLLLVVSFGVDLFLFISLFTFFVLLTIYVYLEFGSIKILQLNKAIIPFFILTFYVFLISFLNFRVYGFIQPYQAIFRDENNTYFSEFFQGKPVNERYTLFSSSSILKTLPAVLFNVGKLFPDTYQNLSSWPDHLKIKSSYYYLGKYNFFGLFIISPFLLISFLIVFLKEKFKLMTLFGFWIFALNLMLQLLSIGFWGGTQYDVRYFYPYIIMLLIPTGLVINAISNSRVAFFRYLSLIFFNILGLFSLFMGWMGILSMYKPALTGERRMWIDLLTFTTKYKLYTPIEYLNATFPNRENAWIPIVMTITVYSLWLLSRYLYARFSAKK